MLVWSVVRHPLLPAVMMAAFACGLFGGCGGKAATDPQREPVYKASGVVTRKGAPVEGAVVQLLSTSGKPGASGVTDAQGKFVLSTYGNGDGAVEGEFVVLISKPDSTSALPASGATESDDYVPPPEPTGDQVPQRPKNLLPAKYANPLQSGLKTRIDSQGDNTKLEFDLTD
uniref:Carboxypeptidase regulatory-like domain-containing protein n=1 Tax=Schlesneria paludicola TaxID=360056 RepID=A0A7C4QP63_9PLAN